MSNRKKRRTEEEEIPLPITNDTELDKKLLEEKLTDEEIDYALLKEKEQEYMVKECIDEKVRFMLTSWLIEVCLDPVTLHKTIAVLDKFLSIQKRVKRSKLQLVGVACLWIVSKAEEVHPGNAQFMIELCGDCNYTKKELVEMELLVLETLNWKIHPVVQPMFIDFEMNRNPKLNKDLLTTLSAITLTSTKFLRYPPSKVVKILITIVNKSTLMDESIKLLVRGAISDFVNDGYASKGYYKKNVVELKQLVDQLSSRSIELI